MRVKLTSSNQSTENRSVAALMMRNRVAATVSALVTATPSLLIPFDW
jgi:hypothetical protein